MTQHTRTIALTALLAMLFGAAVTFADHDTSSDLLLPYFEVDVAPAGRSTLFSVVNTSDEDVPVAFAIYSNWGIKVLDTETTVGAHHSLSINLFDWIGRGALPAGQLSDEELGHLHAALCGLRSPMDDKFYSTEVELMRAVGYVTIRSGGWPRPDVLLGDYFIVDPGQDLAQGDLLHNTDVDSGSCAAACRRRALRFLNGGGFDGGTQLMIWTSRNGPATDDGYFVDAYRVQAVATFYSTAGEVIDERFLELLPVEILDIAELGISKPFGWIDLETEDETYIGVRLSASNRFSVGFQSFCLPLEVTGGGPVPRIDLEKHTNGEDADKAPGPELQVGDAVTWEYFVTNKGQTVLTDIELTDDQIGAIDCPESELEPGEKMTCTADGTAVAGQYENLGTVTGRYGSQTVRDTDPSHYFADSPLEPLVPAIDLEKATNGQDADSAPGPHLTTGDSVTWTFVVTNTGESTLYDVAVTDDQEGPISCPKTTLQVGEAMTCTAQGTAVEGQYGNLGTVNGHDEDGQPVGDSDPSHYFAENPPEPLIPAIDLEKATNGQDADSAPGPQLTTGDAVTWTYVVTNTGESTLYGVAVSDDQEGPISCPKTTLQVGEAMTCTAQGTAVEGQYGNLGTVNGHDEDGQPVSDSDPSHYFAEKPPAGDQGCTPGYWKNHADSWPATGFATGQSAPSVFSQAAAYTDPAGATLHEALYFNGGSGVDGAVRNLMRAAVAGLLDSAHPGVDYPRSTAGVIADVDAALASGDRDTMLALAAAIDADNNLGCPLN